MLLMCSSLLFIRDIFFQSHNILSDQNELPILYLLQRRIKGLWPEIVSTLEDVFKKMEKCFLRKQKENSWAF